MKKFRSIPLIPRVGVWPSFLIRKNDPAFSRFRDNVFSRDEFTCQFCGFQAKQHQEVINANGNFSDNRLDNLVTSCCFCAQCFFLEAVGKFYGGGTFIYLPHMRQNDLNAMCHVLFSILKSPGSSPYRLTSQAIYNDLKNQAKPVEKKFGKGLSKPDLLAQVMIDTPLKSMSERAALQAMKDIRLLPSRKHFEVQIAHWSKANRHGIFANDNE